MSLSAVSSQKAQQLLNQGAALVDIRERDEHVRERIPGARHHALSTITTPLAVDGAPVIFHCRSGNRTQGNAARLEAAVQCQAFVLDGGIDAWKKAGLPVIQDKRQPIELMRQVQIVAGSLVVLGVGLGTVVSPAFYALSGFVGAGLVFAGATGTCAMARILSAAPWNRRAAAPASA